MISTSFVLLMMLIGGVIGYLADSWGHKIGKKRLSFLGLRPRYTATLITVGAGVLIPLVTVLLVAAVSSGVRRWLLEGQRAIEQSRELQASVTELQGRSKFLQAEIRDKAARQKALDAKLATTEARVVEFRKKADKYMAAAAAAAANANRLTARLTSIARQLADRQRDLHNSKLEIQKRKQELAALTKSFDEANRQREEAYRENLRLLKENDQLDKDLRQLKADIASLTEQKGAAEANLKDVEDRLATTSDKLKEISAQLVQTNLALGQKTALLDKATQEVELYKLINNRSRYAPIIFSVGEELARVMVPPKSAVADTSMLIESVLRSARVEAKSRGASPSADLAEAGMLPIGGLSVEQQKMEIALQLAGKNDYSVLIAYTRGNAFWGESVPVELKGYASPLVYKAGHVIRETEVNGLASETEVVAAISEFIRIKVVPKALDDGMIPAHGREESLGSVPTNEVLELVKSIRERGKRARVRAEAAQDTRAGDHPLKLKLTVR